MSEDLSARRPKHLELDSAVCEINRLSERISELLSKINGPKPETPEEPKNPDEPTLYDVLTYGADKIRSRLEDMHQMVNEIEQALF